ncbi:ATP-binding protein [Brumimicrobium oceani]|uniref:ATP-binding protein n=1 Tax=Brumimicrobium oceani TaxID=2100725 RepID=UPI0029392444|nr:ATP-binding protein [Brumimicrobium oceani]
MREIINQKEYLFLDGDDSTVLSLLKSPNTEQIRSIIGSYKLIFIDEAQRIEGIGLTLKIITDQFKDVQLLVSGSSSFDLTNALNERLTERKWDFELFPVSWEEFENKRNYLIAEQQLENRLLYGFYPDILNHPGEERELLNQLVSSYLYQDILSFSNIRKPEVLEKLVRVLALQLGNEVSYNELAKTIGIDKNTVANYIDILEKGYVVFKLDSFSRNVRNEIKKNKKIYFYDNGVRNTVIGNFKPLDLRQDKGALWENFLISERLKQNTYKNTNTKMYFWRTKQQQEVDLVEEKDGVITGFEFKWKAKNNLKLPRTFVNEYGAKEVIIDRSNFRNLQ